MSRSNKKSVVIGCRSSASCYFRVVCRANKNATYISSLQDSHSCRRNAASPGTTPARAEASHVRFLLSEIPRLFDMKNKIKGQDVVDAVKRYHGYDISMRQAQRALIRLQPRNSHSQNEDVQSQDDSISDQQTPQQHQSEQHRDGSEYSDLSENRWIPDHLQSGLINDAYVQQNEVQHSSGPPRPQPHIQAAQHSGGVQHSHAQQPAQVQIQPRARPQDRAPLNHSIGFHGHPPRLASDQLPVPPPVQPRPQEQPYPDGHPAAPQLVLTNFKIEFTCTSCGALNQSFFPNQGDVTRGNHLSQNPGMNHANIARPTHPSTQNLSRNRGHNVGNVDGYEGAATANTRDLHPPWTAGNLSVSIPPAHR